MLPTKIHKTLVIPTNGRNLLFPGTHRDNQEWDRFMWSGRPRPLPLLLVLSLKSFQSLAPTPAQRTQGRARLPVVPHDDDREIRLQPLRGPATRILAWPP
jgi:hypothetical protein